MQRLLETCSENGFFEELSESAENGSASANLTLGISYLVGQGVPQDEKRGINLLAKAAGEKVALAQAILGVAFEEGLFGVEKNEKIAVAWLRRAAEQQVDLAIQRLAERGDSRSQYQYGKMCAEGLGVERDIQQAFIMFKKAALKGHTLASDELVKVQNKLLMYITPRSLCNLFVELCDEFKPEEIFDLLEKLDLSKVAENRKMAKEYSKLCKVLFKSEKSELIKLANEIARLNEDSQNQRRFFTQSTQDGPVKKSLPDVEFKADIQLQ